MTSRAMKDSGIEWIGKIPINWKISKVKHITYIQGGSGFPVKLQGKNNGKYPFYKNSDFSNNERNLIYANNYVDDRDAIDSKLNIIPTGSIVMSKIGESMKKNHRKITTEPSIVDNNLQALILKDSKKLNLIFFYYLMSIIDSNWFDNKGTVPSINNNLLRHETVYLPNIEEQQKIATFLDEKVSYIDNIIEDTKKSIENLKVYKQSLITETITKGMEPNVETKDSGVEWVGEIPSHWKINRLKRIFKIKKNIANQLGYDILSVTQKGLKVKDISSNEGQLSADYSKYQIVEKNDFVMNHMDLLTGWVDLSKFEGVTSPDYRVFKSIKANIINNLFYKYVFQLGYSNKIFYGLGQGVSNKGRWRLPTDQFLNFEIPIPPIEEQRAIAMFLSEKTSHISLLIEQKEQFVTELESYKKSFIYEYITGKKEVK